jgi:hypothetical protein
MDAYDLREKVQFATKLLHLGLSGKIPRNFEKEFNALINVYNIDPDVRVIFDEMTETLGLKILDVDYAGVYFQPLPRSLFSIKSNDIAQLKKKESSKYTILFLFGIASYLYPDDAAFNRDRFTSQFFSINDIILSLDKLCSQIITNENLKDPEKDKEGLIPIAKAYLNLKSESQQNTRQKNTKQYFLKQTLKFLQDQGFIKEKIDGQIKLYETLPIMRFQIEEMVQDPDLIEFFQDFKKKEDSS